MPSQTDSPAPGEHAFADVSRGPHESSAGDPRTPVTVLTGWLGAGKTTLLNRILEHARTVSGARYAVLVNEFGELSIDDRLVVATEEDLVELAGGCVCCTVRGDLVRALQRIHQRARGGFLRRARPIDRVLIETTGLAQPAPIVKTFLADERVAADFRPPTVVTLVDAHAAERALSEAAAREQIAVADRIVLNKTDLADAAGLDALEERLVRLNPLAELERATHAQVALEALLEAGSARSAERLLSARAALARGFRLHPPHAAQGETHAHDVGSVALVADQPLDEMKLRLWLDACVHLFGERLLRFKGFVHVAGREQRIVVQGVYDFYSARAGAAWGDDPRRTELVFIGRELERGFFERGLRAALAGP